MKDFLILIAHLLTTIAKLMGPGSARAVVTDSLAFETAILTINRCRRRAPRLTARERFLFGFCSLFLSTRRIQKVAVITGHRRCRDFMRYSRNDNIESCFRLAGKANQAKNVRQRPSLTPLPN